MEFQQISCVYLLRAIFVGMDLFVFITHKRYKLVRYKSKTEYNTISVYKCTNGRWAMLR